MSGLLNAASPSQLQSFGDCLERRSQVAYLPASASSQLPIFVDLDAVAPASFASEYWPGAAELFDTSDGPSIEQEIRWGYYDQAAGASFRYAFTGVTRDQYGSPVGSCAVKLYRTSDDTLLDSQVSDPSGNFLLSTAYYPDTHYIVAHKSGSPDIDGVTVNTLIGA
jgi:hypothetical protein